MLKGLRIVEYATYVAAPGAGGVMADWGADVIKVEPPGGDPIRLFFSSLGVEGERNPVFDMDNRGKRGVILDTTKEAGREALMKLVDQADIFLTNVRPGGLTRAGLGYEALAARNPRLIYATLTGYGLEGPDADRPGLDAAAFWARSGLASLFRPKGGEPLQLRTAFGDHVTSLAIISAVLAALHERTQTGKGRIVEASLLRTAHYVGSSDMAIQHAFGRIASNRPRESAPNPLVNFFQTSDGHWVNLLARQGSGDWPALARALGFAELIDDPRFNKARSRRENSAALVGLIDAAFASRTFEQMAAALDAEQIIWAPVQTAAEAIADPQAQAAGCIVQTPSHDGGTFAAPAGPVRFPGVDTSPKGPAPRKGEHTRAVLAELGYGEDVIAAMFESGAAA